MGLVGVFTHKEKGKERAGRRAKI